VALGLAVERGLDGVFEVGVGRALAQDLAEVGGVVLAEAQACVMVFETGLPTRYYVDATNVHFRFLRPSSTRSQCPYKGMTGGYWSAETNGKTVKDVAWTYLFTTPAMTPIAGLLAFLNENVDIFVDGELQARPTTHFS